MSVPPIDPPYPPPAKWPQSPPKREPWWKVAVWSGVFVVGMGSAAVRIADGNIGWALVLAYVFGAIGLVAVGEFWKHRPGLGRPEMINSVVLTRAERRPTDSWVHVFRERRERPSLIVALSVYAVVLGAVAVAAMVAIVTVGASGWLFAAALPPALGALVTLLAAVVLLVSRVRGGSVGRRPVGLAIGPTGFVVYDIGGQTEVGWADVTAVTGLAPVAQKDGRDAFALVLVETAGEAVLVTPYDPGASPYPVQDALVTPDDFAASPHLVYCALRFYAEHPQERRELGTTFAQQRMLGWRAAILGARHPLEPASEGTDAEAD